MISTKMKASGLLMAVFLFQNCQSYGEIKVRNDSFKNSKNVSMKLNHKSEEKFGFFNAQLPIEITYVKELKSGQEPIIEMKIITPADATTELKPQAFIKADKEKFEVKLDGIKKTSMTESETKNKRDDDGRLIDSKTETTTHYASMATISVPINIWRAMIKANKVGYRIYIDQEALSFLVSEEWQEKLREFDAQ